MSRTLEVFEHRKLVVTATGPGLREHELDALVRFNDRHGGKYFEVGHKHLKAKNYVGYVEVGGLSIEILPKADRDTDSPTMVWRDGLLEMLRVALGLRLASLPVANQRLTRNRLMDLVAQAYLVELEPLLREGLARGYRTTESNDAVFRGQLQISDHLRENVARRDRFFVEYQSFDRDILINRVLAAALESLSWCGLSAGVASRVEASLAHFPELDTGNVTIEALDRIQLTRATQRYAQAMTYARMILGGRGPHLRSGSDRVFALLFDMNALWERYVATLLRRAAPRGLNVHAQERHAFWAPEQQRARSVKPDLVVRADVPAGRGPVLMVIDTKWKVAAKGAPSDEDLKQMFAYNELLAGPRSVLLYPGTVGSVPVTGSFATKLHTCEQRHLRMVKAGAWSTSEIQQQLAELMGEVGGGVVQAVSAALP